MNKGVFIISLDFELMWGVRDKRTISDYGDAILGVRETFDRLLHLFSIYKVAVTFSTVGFLFNRDKQEFLDFPSELPQYRQSELNPYPVIETAVGKDEGHDPYHYAPSLIQKIINEGKHEIGTHTYSHFYCLEDGVTSAQFIADIKKAKAVASLYNVQLRSIIFPRNQYNTEILNACRELGILVYRGNEESAAFASSKNKDQTLKMRLMRLMDSYFNVLGHHTYPLSSDRILINLPSSRFFRAFNPRLHFLESLKMKRIINSLTYAARNNQVFHLWWHPHNFGRNSKENFAQLETILKHYQFLKDKYGFESLTMLEAANRVQP